MPPQRVDSLTPVRIRGKRHGAPTEKWHHGKCRSSHLKKRPATKGPSSSATSPERSNKRRRRRGNNNALVAESSGLERLPAEVIQQVFEYSANIELPSTSRTLASRLSQSHHLQHRLTSEILQNVLGQPATPKKADLHRATRLLNSRFVTWSFFTSWLREYSATETLSSTSQDQQSGEPDDVLLLWLALKPPRDLLPPKKLLCPTNGFSRETVKFLTVLSQGVEDLPNIDPVYAEVAHEGLLQAVRGGWPGAVSLILKMGIVATTELLRVAVAEAGCDMDIVQMLLSWSNDEETTRRVSHSEAHRGVAEGIDLLDLELWSWAEKAQQRGNQRGAWLVAELKSAQQKRG